MDAEILRKLQKPSVASPLLNHLMRDVVCKLEMISEVRAARLESETARLKSGSVPPQGSGLRVAEIMVNKYDLCESNWERMMVVRRAQQIYRESREGQSPARRRGTREWREAITNDTRASALVGRDYGISASYVRKIRNREG